MGRKESDFKLPQGLEVTGQYPVDHRLLLESINDVTLEGGDVFGKDLNVYRCMIVTVRDEKSQYMFIADNVTKDSVRNLDNWVKVEADMNWCEEI